MATCFPSGGVAHTLQDFECILTNVFNIIIPFAGLAAFVVLLVGGFQYLTSAGDPKKAQQAQGVITGAIIGIIVTLGIWFLFQLIFVLTGIDVLKFEIPN
jgi:hypothetical protein